MDNKCLYRPRRKTEWRILTSRDTGYETYYAFPTLLKEGDEVLIAVKTGSRHWGDREASLSLVCVDIRSQSVKEVQTLFRQQGLTPQQGEIVRMPCGDLCVYIDMQKSETNRRTGMWELRSRDGGKTFPVSKPVGSVAGVEYGYPLSMAEKNGKVYLLAMTFDYLEGGLFREVHVLSSMDSGASWHFEANLSRMIGAPFNESCILPWEKGFLIMTRGERDRTRDGTAEDEYDSGQYMLSVDDQFHVLNMRDLRHKTGFFSLTGRPRLYWVEDQLCLVTRQRNERADGEKVMTLDLFRIHPETLEIQARVRLDEGRFPSQDGHYPVLYLHEGKLHVVTYLSSEMDKGECAETKCDLVQLSFDLHEILSYGREENK
ncbi:MAG: glycoside hydrolase [Clostridiales bacterium]|nr:glycoside hydrolase [Clostridiales bacterium]